MLTRISLFSALAFAQHANGIRETVVSSDYGTKAIFDMDGVYKSTQSTLLSGYKKKSCRAHGGQWLGGRGLCRFEKTTASVAIEKSQDSETYKVSIKNKMDDGSSCEFESYGTVKNKVQLSVPALEGQCVVTVGFTSPQTLAVWGNQDCTCESADLTIKNASRVVTKAK